MLNRFRRITSDTWFALGLEFFAIIIGVLIALGVDEWRDEQEIEQNIEVAMERLNGEIIQNHDAIEDSIAIIEERFARLSAMQADDERAFSELVQEFGGYHFAELKDSVWRRISDDQLANRMPGDYIEAGFRLYSMNELLDSLRQRTFELTTSADFHDPGRARIAHGISVNLLRQQIVWAREALAIYDYFIQQHMDPEHSDQP